MAVASQLIISTQIAQRLLVTTRGKKNRLTIYKLLLEMKQYENLTSQLE